MVTLYLCIHSSERMATPESFTIDRNIGTISQAISECCSITWFANRLLEEGFITSEVHGDVLGTQGISPYDQCTMLVHAVRAQVDLDQSRFDIFTGILKKENPLKTVVREVEQCYQGEEGGIVLFIVHQLT